MFSFIRNLFKKKKSPTFVDDFDYESIDETNASHTTGHTFSMDYVEYSRYIEFQKRHKNCIPYKGASGGGFSVIFEPCGIGYGIVVRCDGCGKTVDITNLNNW